MGKYNKWSRINKKNIKKMLLDLQLRLLLMRRAQKWETEKGAVWLNEDLFSFYDYWQFWKILMTEM